MASSSIFTANESKLGIILFFFLGLQVQHMEAPRLGIELELQLLAYVTATAILDLSPIFNLRHRSRQHSILNPLSEVRDRTPASSWILARLVTTEPQWELPRASFFVYLFLFVFGHAEGMWRFPGQGSKVRHSSDTSHFSDNTPQGNSQGQLKSSYRFTPTSSAFLFHF